LVFFALALKLCFKVKTKAREQTKIKGFVNWIYFKVSFNLDKWVSIYKKYSKENIKIFTDINNNIRI